jgi:hypothetical protein
MKIIAVGRMPAGVRSDWRARELGADVTGLILGAGSSRGAG